MHARIVPSSSNSLLKASNFLQKVFRADTYAILWLCAMANVVIVGDLNSMWYMQALSVLIQNCDPPNSTSHPHCCTPTSNASVLIVHRPTKCFHLSACMVHIVKKQGILKGPLQHWWALTFHNNLHSNNTTKNTRWRRWWKPSWLTEADAISGY